MIFNTAEFKISVFLQLLRQGRERFVLKTVRKLPPQIAVFQSFSRRDEIRLYRVVIAPHLRQFMNISITADSTAEIIAIPTVPDIHLRSHR